MVKRNVTFIFISIVCFLLLSYFSVAMAEPNTESKNLITEVPPNIPEIDTSDKQSQKDKKVLLPGTGHDGPELKEFLNSVKQSPEERFKSEGILVDNVYAPLFKRLALPQDKQNEFRKLLIKIRISWNDQEDEVRHGGTSDVEVKNGFKKMQTSAWELDNQIKQFLGSSDYKKYNEYKSSLGIFMSDAVDEFEGTLSAEEQINENQESQLVSAMAEEFEGFISSVVGKLQGPPSYRVEMRDKDVQKKINTNFDKLKNRYFERTKSILTEVQFIKYKSVIESKMNNRKTWSEERVNEMEELSKTKKPVLYRDFRDK
jgi:hypothetical protein